MTSIRLAVIKDKIRWAAQMFQLREICFDPWGLRETASDLAEEGFAYTEINQNYGKLSDPRDGCSPGTSTANSAMAIIQC